MPSPFISFVANIALPSAWAMALRRILAGTLLVLFPLATEAREVRVATFNVENGTGEIGSAKYEAILAILERMDADVVSFQELRTATFAAWSNLAAELDYPYSAIGGNGPFSGSLYNGYFSRFPIRSTHNVESPPGAVELTRFPFRAVIDVPDAQRPLVIWTMHHKSAAGSADKFRRSIEAYRIAQDIDAYLADNPDHVEYVLTGDMNDDVRDNQTPAQFAGIPTTSGMPSSYVLGSDIQFPVPYAVFPTHRYAQAGEGLLHVPAHWEGTANPVTRPASSRQLDYVFLSPALMHNPLGAPQSEIYYSETDMGAGLPKVGIPLPFEFSALASDHLPIFVDVHMTSFSPVLPSATFRSIGEAGGPFSPEYSVYTLTETNSFDTFWTVESDAGWLSVDPAHFWLSPFSPAEVDAYLTDSAVALPPGIYFATVSFRNETTGQLIPREAQLTVRDHLAVTPADGFFSSGIVEGPFLPASKTYVVTNKSQLSISFAASARENWLTVAPSSWLLHPGQSVEVNVQLNANATALPIGLHGDAVVFSNQTTGLTEERPVALAAAGKLCDAVDACALAWSTGGDSEWFHQTSTTFDGIDAAQSGPLATNQQSWIETVVEGPLRIAFRWKVSSRSTHHLRFLVNGTSQASIAGEVDWTRQMHEIADGVHTLRWALATTAAAPQGSNAGWLDQIVLDHLAATPASGWVAAGAPGGPFSPATRTYVLTNSGSQSLPWTAFRDVGWLDVSPAGGVLAPGASEAVEAALNALAYAQPLGTYPGQLVFSNHLTGFVLERPVQLSTTGSLCDAVDQCHLDWTTGGDAPWFNQTATTFDGLDAAQSGPLSTNQQSWIETTVEGPARVSFQWRVSSRSSHYLRFLVNGTQQAQIGGTPAWAMRTHVLPAGVHTLRWSYATTTLSPLNANAGWLDQVVVDTFTVSSTNGWHASGRPGGPFVAGPRYFALANRGPDSAAWTASSSVDWLTVSPASGMLAPGESLQVEALPGGAADALPAGTHFGTLVFSNQTSGLATPVPATLDTRGLLCEAVEACNLDWISGGHAPWFPQTLHSFDGIDAAQSGALSTNQQTWLDAVVEGPAHLRFHWRVSSRTNSHYFRFLENGVVRAFLSGETDWVVRSYELAPGIQTVRWAFANNTQAPVGSNAAWLDRVSLDHLAVLPMDSWTASGLPGGPFAPSSRIHVVTNSGTVPLAWNATSSANWLTVEPAEGELAPGEGIAVEVGIHTNANAFTLGTRIATTTFSNLTTGVAVTRSTTLVVQDHLVITPTSSSHSGFVGGPYSPASRLFSLSNSGPDAISWTIARTTNWLSLSPDSGTLEPGETGEVLLTFTEDADALPAIWNSAQIVFSNSTTRLAQTRWIYLSLQEALVLLSSGWAPTGPVGGPFQPTTHAVVFTNRSQQPLPWALSTSVPWIALGTESGTLPPGSSQTVLAMLNEHAESLPPALHEGALVLHNLDNGRPATQTVSLAVGLRFCEALDACELPWTMGGDAPWLYQTNVTHDGIAAAASGAITHDQHTWLETAVAGPGNLSFWWKVSSEANYDYLEFWIDGALAGRISGEIDWQRQTYDLPSGPHALRWRYIKDEIVSTGEDRAWLDQVTFAPTRTAMGVPIAWYLAFNLHPGDGQTWDDLDHLPAVGGDPHWRAYRAGLDPLLPGNRFEILGVRQTLGEPLRIEWRGGLHGPAKPYDVQSAPDLHRGPWESIGSSPRADGLNVWTSSVPADALRFYRIRALPDP